MSMTLCRMSLALALDALLLPIAAHAAVANDCITQAVKSAAEGTPVEVIRDQCQTAAQAADQLLPNRVEASRNLEANARTLLPLRQNYILPYTFNPDPNQMSYQGVGGQDVISEEEVKLQISLKFPLSFADVLTANDGIYLGFTMKSFWQLYNKGISSPFRETSYRPEFFYEAPLPFSSKNGAWLGRVGVEHESNGRTQLLSRSWNRTYVSLAYAEENWGIALQPWYRLPENGKVDDGNTSTLPAAAGDDNPDIDDYMGHFELTGAYRWRQLEFSGLFRRNFDEGKGAHEVGVSFPLWGRLRGYTQYFEGYGENMIDYNFKNRRIGVGFLFTDAL